MRSTRALLAACAAALGFALVLRAFQHPLVEGDTVTLLRGARAARLCFSRGAWGHCPEASYFPVAQYIPAWAALAAGFRLTFASRVLIATNLASFVATPWLIWWALRERAGASVAALVALIAVDGPMLYYAGSSFNEMTAACLTVAAVALTLRRAHPVACGAAFFAASLTKEIALPFLALLAAGALLPELARKGERPWRHLAGAAAGSALGLVATSLFNHFREGGFSNTFLLQPMLRVPWTSVKVTQSLALWFAPSSGVAVFWPAMTAVLAVGLASSARALRTDRSLTSPGWSGALVALALAALTWGLGGWYSPFGWWAWGPRLMLPWLPAFAVLGAASLTEEARALAGRIVARPELTAAALSVCALPHVAAVFDPDMVNRFLGPDAVCPRQVIIQMGAEPFYECAHHYIWAKGSMMSGFVDVYLRSWAGVAWALLAAVNVAALRAARAIEEPPRPDVGAAPRV